MDNNLAKFENDVFGDLNTVVINEEIWLNANDVCRALGYNNPHDALARHVDDPDLVKHEGWVVTGKKADGTDAKRKTQINYVNESGFYSLEFGKLSVIIEHDNDGEVKNYWFIANEVCNILGYKNPRKALEDHVDEDDKKVMPSLMSRNVTLEIPNRGINVINESGLYSLILRSRKKKAKQFKKWVTSEVLPSIRKQGYYVDKERMEYLEEVNKQYQQMTNSSGLFSITTIAKAYGLSGIKLNQLLNDWKIQYKQNNTWTLYTDYSDKGYTAIRTHTHLNHDDECWYTTALTYWTSKGKMFIDEQMKQHGYHMV